MTEYEMTMQMVVVFLSLGVIVGGMSIAGAALFAVFHKATGGGSTLRDDD